MTQTMQSTSSAFVKRHQPFAQYSRGEKKPDNLAGAWGKVDGVFAL
jgi:hypothetical protein